MLEEIKIRLFTAMLEEIKIRLFTAFVAYHKTKDSSGTEHISVYPHGVTEDGLFIFLFIVRFYDVLDGGHYSPTFTVHIAVNWENPEQSEIKEIRVGDSLLIQEPAYFERLEFPNLYRSPESYE
jgi:hypothetical protein